MGFFDKIKKGFESAMAYAKMDDFLIDKIDAIFCKQWQKISQRTPSNAAGISQEDEAEYNFVYQTPQGNVTVEMEHEWPTLEIELKTPHSKFETRIQVSDFVEKIGKDMKLVNGKKLNQIISDLMGLA
ncbi:MAG: hypothetical protein GY729_11815 [Desulfobacteraceae bacterium]|nr:hypothetical protein [Desulfobacteraceae bacterium]